MTVTVDIEPDPAQASATPLRVRVREQSLLREIIRSATGAVESSPQAATIRNAASTARTRYRGCTVRGVDMACSRFGWRRRSGTPADLRRFIGVPWHVEALTGSPNWAPPLRQTVRDALDVRGNPFYHSAGIGLWIAERDLTANARALGAP